MTWVIDTCVLAVATPTNEQALDAIHFLNEVLRSHCIAVDEQGEIEREYQPYMRWGSIASWWWQKMVGQAGKIWRFDGRLTQHHRQHLLGRLNFDPSDAKFIAVASRTSNRLLVSEDSDYNADVKDYLEKEMDVAVLSLGDALARA